MSVFSVFDSVSREVLSLVRLRRDQSPSILKQTGRQFRGCVRVAGGGRPGLPVRLPVSVDSDVKLY